MNIAEEILRNAIAMCFVLLGTGIAAVFSGAIVMWLHVRSLRKAMRSAFDKIRRIEKKVFGHETCEDDFKEGK